MSALSVTFWTLFHSLLRAETPDEEDKIRARKNCAWMVSELTLIQRFLTLEEEDILQPVYEHWRTHGEAPSFTILNHIISKKGDTVTEENLKDYQDMVSGLKALQVEDLKPLLAEKIEEYKTDRLEGLLAQSQKINRDGAKKNKTDPKTGVKTQVVIKGPEEAVNYLITQVAKGGLGGIPAYQTHGKLQDSVDRIVEIINENSDPLTRKNKRIFTGLTTLDEYTQMRRGNFVGILAFAKQGKTHFVRTLCYNAARDGNNVLHYTLEQSYEEELTHYAVIHSWNPKWGRDGIIWNDLHAGSIEAKDKAWFIHEVLPDLRSGGGLPGNLYIQEPQGGTTWDAIRSDVVMRDRNDPLDMFMIDYLALIKTGKFRKEEVEEAIADAQDLALSHRDHEGLLVCTPVQGNRTGFAEAGKDNGVWGMDGIFMYSAFERYLDLCYTMFADERMRIEHKRILGSALNRRGPDAPPHEVSINHKAGMLCDYKVGVDMTEKDMDDLLMECG